MDDDRRPCVRHLERRTGAHEVVLHVDDEERGRREPVGRRHLGGDERCESGVHDGDPNDAVRA